jgi:NADPH:quinone reductase-like Zn-dependent oxidoreductase
VKALVLRRYGEAMKIEDRPPPVVGGRDVLIDIKAAGLNPLDAKLRDGKVKLAVPLKLPAVLGSDVAGVVTACGGEVTKFNVGDEVFARLEKLRMGGFAEEVAAHEDVVAKKPARTTFAEAAAVPLAGLTSLQALRDVAKLKPGQRVLIHAGAGGVGSLAIQIAKIVGLHVTTTTSTKNIDLVKQLGADEVIDYTKERVVDRAKDLDAVFETLGGASELEALRVVKRGGVVVGIGGLPDLAFAREWLPVFVRPALWLMTSRRRRIAKEHGTRFEYLFMRPDGKELAELAAWIDEGRLRPVLHRTYPFADIGDAFVELERGHARGKIVVTHQPANSSST